MKQLPIKVADSNSEDCFKSLKPFTYTGSNLISTQTSSRIGATQVHVGEGVDYSLRRGDSVEGLAVDYVFSWDAVRAEVVGVSVVLSEWPVAGVVGWRPSLDMICWVTPALVARGHRLSSSHPEGTGEVLLEVKWWTCTPNCHRWCHIFGVSFGEMDNHISFSCSLC